MTQAKQFVPMSKDALVKEINRIGKVGNKLNLAIQIAACNAVFYSITEDYIQYGQNLIMAMNAGQRKTSLVAFLEKYGKFQWSKEQKSLVFKKRDDLTVESVDAIAERWFEVLKEPEIKSMYDFEEDVSKFIKRMEKAVTEKATIKHIELMDYIKAAVDQYHAAQVIAEPEEEDVVFTEEDQLETAELLQAALSEEPVRQSMRRAA